MTHDPTEPFWLALSMSRIDDMLDLDLHNGVEGIFETENDARDHIKELLREYGTEGFIYRCVPVSSVTRQPRITKLKTRDLLSETPHHES